MLVPLAGDKGLALGPDGHHRCLPSVASELVYIVQTDAGQETLTPDEFARRFTWQNDPEK